VNLRTPRRRGFTLVELLVVMWSLGVCLALGIALIVTTLKANQTGDTSANLVNHRAELSRQFRDDVAGAADAINELHGGKAGADRLILRMPGGRTIQYVWAKNGLERIETVEGKESHRPMPMGEKVTAVEFFRAGSSSKLVTLRWTESAKNGPGKKSELTAVLGGDLR